MTEKPAFFDLTGEVGPWIIGNILSTFLFGMLALQLVTYFVRNPKDHNALHVLVAAMGCLAALSWGADQWMLWHILIRGRSDDWALIISPREAVIPVAVSPFSALLSQSFFALRGWKLANRNMWLAALFIVMMAGTFAAGLGFVITAARSEFLVFGSRDLVNFPQNAAMRHDFWLCMNFIQAFLLSSGVTDVVITTALVLCITRSNQWQRGFNQRTDLLVKKILKLSITTGAISSTSAFVDGFLIIGTIRSQHSFNGHLAMCLIQPHLYALVLVASLNMRRVINADHASTGPHSVHVTGHSGTGSRSGIGSNPPLYVLRGLDSKRGHSSGGQSDVPGSVESPKLHQRMPSYEVERHVSVDPETQSLPSPPPPFSPDGLVSPRTPTSATPLNSRQPPHTPVSPTHTSTFLDAGIAR